MFDVLVGASVVLFILGVLCYRLPAEVFVALAGFYSLASGSIVYLFAPWLLLTYVGLFAAWAMCRWLDWSRLRFSAVSMLAIVGAWGIVVAVFIPQWWDIREMARDYPITSIQRRLAYEETNEVRTEFSSSELSVATTDRLSSRIDQELQGESFFGDKRTISLLLLEETHNDFASAFANQSGFGFFRMPVREIKRENLALPEPTDLKLPPPPPVSISAESEDKSDWMAPEDITETTHDWHMDQIVNFSNPRGFGYILGSNSWFVWSNDNDTARALDVRGFVPHAFHDIAATSPLGEAWQLTRLELVSLLKHDPPAVYLSDSLPRMDELSHADIPTRDLDEFEAAALERLSEGEVIAVRQGPQRVRMLGALLATEQCIKCHNVSAGETLGAFSYEFLRQEPLPPKQEANPTEPPLT